MFTRSKQNANEAQLQFRRENPITLCGRIAHTAWYEKRVLSKIYNVIRKIVLSKISVIWKIMLSKIYSVIWKIVRYPKFIALYEKSCVIQNLKCYMKYRVLSKIYSVIWKWKSYLKIE
jgi:hypothetical protein